MDSTCRLTLCEDHVTPLAQKPRCPGPIWHYVAHPSWPLANKGVKLEFRSRSVCDSKTLPRTGCGPRMMRRKLNRKMMEWEGERQGQGRPVACPPRRAPVLHAGTPGSTRGSLQVCAFPRGHSGEGQAAYAGSPAAPSVTAH